MILTALPIEILADTNIATTNGYTYLLDLISFLCSFFTAPLWFGLSFLNLLVISYVAHFIIGICLGGIAPHAKIEKPIATNSPELKEDRRDWFIEMENKGLDWHTGKYDPALNVLKHKR